MRTAKGYRLPLADVATLFLLPSVFNSRRFKTATEHSTPRRLYIPYLLEEIELPLGLRRTADFEIDFDPWLACRAIGNPTRASILQLIAERPRAAFEISARAFGISKANVSHHSFSSRSRPDHREASRPEGRARDQASILSRLQPRPDPRTDAPNLNRR